MAEPRLKSRLRVQAMLRGAAAGGRFGVVVRHGDDDAGGIVVVLRLAAGQRVLTETRAADGSPAWLAVEPGDEAAVGAYLERRLKTDPDLWVVEIEGGAPDLGAPVLMPA